MPTNQGGYADKHRRKEKISDEEAERRDDDVHGDVHVQHVHVSSRSNWSTDFPGQYDVLLKQDETPSQTAEGRLTCRCFFVAYLCMNQEVVICQTKQNECVRWTQRIMIRSGAAGKGVLKHTSSLQTLHLMRKGDKHHEKA